MLYDKIKAHNKIPFHTPGHKRNNKILGYDLPYNIDITEIDGFDNLNAPSGVLLELNNKINDIYGAKHSYALVNGSTVGILAAVSSTVKQGDTVLMARNCHKSVYNALETAKAKAEFIMPYTDEFGISMGITANQVKEKLSEDIRLIVITSPTYEGVESEVDEICEIAHNRNIPVLIDAAHGAHLFDKYHNADIVIRSLHKTLPALTQCAVANIYGDLINSKRFKIKLSVFQTSSPSYVFLSSIEKCVEFINNNKNIFDEHNKNLSDFYNINLKKLKLLEYDDRNKIVIYCGFTDISGYSLADKLRENNIEIEMSAQNYVIALSSVCDTKENIIALKYALEEIDREIFFNKGIKKEWSALPKRFCEAYEVGDDIEAYRIKDCEGKISAEYIWAYPPGIPLIIPGEVIDNNLIEYLTQSSNNRFQSTYGCLPEKIYCKKYKN